VNSERYTVVVIGAGQAGLAAGYLLSRAGSSYVIVDDAARIGDSWRRRWDSLRLFTPACFDGLPGLPFPAMSDSYPTKDEMADYLEKYAARFGLHVRLSTQVHRLLRRGTRYFVATSGGDIEADRVIVAKGMKRSWDTDNVFHHNQNIRPASS
jgi:putative flavoprotein involved in K+ transport